MDAGDAGDGAPGADLPDGGAAPDGDASDAAGDASDAGGDASGAGGDAPDDGGAAPDDGGTAPDDSGTLPDDGGAVDTAGDTAADPGGPDPGGPDGDPGGDAPDTTPPPDPGEDAAPDDLGPGPGDAEDDAEDAADAAPPCVPVTEAGDPSCDGLDDDCDGATDEDAVPFLEAACGGGGCLFLCVEGALAADRCPGDERLMDSEDTDGDGLLDCNDACPQGFSDWTSTPSTDRDGDACRDAGEDGDDDGDGVADGDDACKLGALGWSAHAVDLAAPLTLPLPRQRLTVVGVGARVFAAGGQLPGGGATGRVDVWDDALGRWYSLALATPRYDLAGASAAGRVVLAGGLADDGPDGMVAAVEVYDPEAGAWSLDTLAAPRATMGAVGAGGRVFLAGGLEAAPGGASKLSARVEIYDPVAGTWEAGSLSVPRVAPAGAAAGGVVLFAGGAQGNGLAGSAAVDLYDLATGAWSTAALSKPLLGVAAATVGTRAFFLGTTTLDDVTSLEVYDAATGTWDTVPVPVPRVGIGLAAVGDHLLAAGGAVWLGGTSVLQDRVDVLDAAAPAWAEGASLAVARRIPHAAGLGGAALFVGSAAPALAAAVDRYEPATDLELDGCLDAVESCLLADGCVGGIEGAWPGTYAVAISTSTGVEDTCAGTLTLTVDPLADPPLQATGTCTFSGAGDALFPGVHTLELSGDVAGGVPSGLVNPLADVVVDPTPWSGAATAHPFALSGTFTQTVGGGGFVVNLSGELAIGAAP